MRAARLLAVASALALVCSCKDVVFECRDAADCTLRTDGACEANGACSYPDADCPGGRRYSEYAGALANECIEDADDSTTGGPIACESCVFVDAIEGDDLALGTEDAPVRTLARASALAPGLAAGEGVYLRRGRVWAEPFVLEAVLGTAEMPVEIGSYGDAVDPPPQVAGGIAIVGSTGVRVRGIAVSSASVGIRIENSAEVVVLDNDVSECTAGCIEVLAGTTHSSIVGNRLASCGTDTFAIALREQEGALGDGHFVLDNRIAAEGTINAIHVELATADDVKIVGNRVRGSVDRALHSRFDGHAWITANVLAQTGDANDAAIDHIGAGELLVRGNVLIDVELPIVLVGRATLEHNTVLTDAAQPALTLAGANGFVLRRNLIATATGPAISASESGVIVDASGNVYASLAGADCTFVLAGTPGDLSSWQSATGHDSDARCEAVAGLAIPASIASPQEWTDTVPTSAAVPSTQWEGCSDPAGAFACDGTAIADDLLPLPGFGLGWRGSADVQARVRFAEE
jgi:hypothetical protein